MHYFIYDLFHHTPMQPRLAGGNHTVSKHGTRHAFDIVRNNIGTPMYSCVCLGRPVEGKCPAWTDAQFDTIMLTCGSYQFNDIAFNARLDAHPADHHLQCLQSFTGEDRSK